MQDHFIFFSKGTAPGRHCQEADCRYKLQNENHYHCKFCVFARRGFVSQKMETHLWSKHKSELAKLGIVKNKLQQLQIVKTEQSTIPTQEICVKEETVPDPAPEKKSPI